MEVKRIRNKAPREAWGCGGLLAQVGNSASPLPQAWAAPNGGSRAGQTLPVLRAGSAQHPHVWDLPWSNQHGANISWGRFLSGFELLLCVLEKELCLSDIFELEMVARSPCGLFHPYLPMAVGELICWLCVKTKWRYWVIRYSDVISPIFSCVEG